MNARLKVKKSINSFEEVVERHYRTRPEGTQSIIKEDVINARLR